MNPLIIENVMKTIDELEDRCLRNWTPVHSLFLNPVEQKIVENEMAHRTDVDWDLDGGYANAENAVLTLWPKLMDHQEREEGVVIYRFIDREKQLKHPQILGSLLGQSLQKSEIGDIIYGEGYWYVILQSDAAKRERLTMIDIHRDTVKLERVDSLAFEPEPPKGIKAKVVVSSLRLDNYVKEVYNIKRKDSQSMIDKGLVKVNYFKEWKPSTLVEEGDMVSVRHYGRSELLEIVSETKKGNLLIEVFRLT